MFGIDNYISYAQLFCPFQSHHVLLVRREKTGAFFTLMDTTSKVSDEVVVVDCRERANPKTKQCTDEKFRIGQHRLRPSIRKGAGISFKELRKFRSV